MGLRVSLNGATRVPMTTKLSAPLRRPEHPLVCLFRRPLSLAGTRGPFRVDGHNTPILPLVTRRRSRAFYLD